MKKNMDCPKCASTKKVKSGIVKSRQRFKCKECGCNYTVEIKSTSPFDKTVKRVTEQTAEIRNKMMIELADNITIGFASKGGKPETLLKTTEKPITKLV